MALAPAVTTSDDQDARRKRGRREGGDERGPRGPRDNNRDREEGPEFIEKLVSINRIAKVVKGGRRFSFAAMVVVGDGKGRVGFGTSKAKEVPDAVRKATEQAKRKMVRIPMREGRTLHHDLVGQYGAGSVVLRAAPAGTGIIAGGPMRAIFEALGVADIVSKSIKSSNPHNMVRATFTALENASNPRQIAARRGRKISDIIRKQGKQTQSSEQEASVDATQDAVADNVKE